MLTMSRNYSMKVLDVSVQRVPECLIIAAGLSGTIAQKISYGVKDQSSYYRSENDCDTPLSPGLRVLFSVFCVASTTCLSPPCSAQAQLYQNLNRYERWDMHEGQCSSMLLCRSPSIIHQRSLLLNPIGNCIIDPVGYAFFTSWFGEATFLQCQCQ